MKDIMIIANPSSGKKKAVEYAKDLKENFLLHGRKSDIKCTEKTEDISRFALNASQQAYNLLIVIGGDGTVSEAANGWSKETYRPVIGIIPAGTVNNISKGLNIPDDPDKVISQIINYREKRTDAGRVNARVFLSSVSAGSVPETVWEVSDEQKEKYGQAAYFVEGFKSLRDEETYAMELIVDEQKVDIDLNLVLVGVNSSIAGIPNFFEQAEMNDGQLYLFGLKGSTFGEKLTVLQALLFSNKAFNDIQDIAFTVGFKRAVFTIKNSEAHAAVDGDQGPEFPLIIEALPQYFSFLVPEEN